MKPLKIYFDGEYIAANDSMLSGLRPGILNAKGLFETFRVYDGQVFLLEEHISRLRKGLKYFDLTLSLSVNKIHKMIQQTLTLCGLQNARVRFSLWKESGQKHISIIAQPLHLPSDQKYRQGFKVKISSLKCSSTRTLHLKTYDYQIFFEAFEDAIHAGFDEALIFNQAGDLSESCRANVFIVKNRVLLTPPVRSGCLNGITRQQIIKIAQHNNFKMKVARIRKRDVLSCDEIFITNSCIEVMPVVSVDHQKVASGKPGVVTHQFCEMYQEFRDRLLIRAKV